MEMAIDREDFDFEIFEDDNFTKSLKMTTLHQSKKQNGCVRSAALKWQADLIKSSAPRTVARDILSQQETLTAAQQSVERTESFLTEH